VTHEDDLRAAIEANARWAAANEPTIHYTQDHRRFDALHTPRPDEMWADCSSIVTMYCAWAGAPDPNGLGYSGSGFTGTLLEHCEEIPPLQVQVGDFDVYGYGPGDHVDVVVETGTDPLVVSHGQERGPILIRRSVEFQAQVRIHGRSKLTCLRSVPADAPAPAPVPPPHTRPRRHRKMIVFRLQSDYDAGRDYYHVWQGPGAWSPVTSLADAISLSAGTGQASIPVISDDVYHTLGGK
jgi:hypothetical protein